MYLPKMYEDQKDCLSQDFLSFDEHNSIQRHHN